MLRPGRHVRELNEDDCFASMSLYTENYLFTGTPRSCPVKPLLPPSYYGQLAAKMTRSKLVLVRFSCNHQIHRREELLLSTGHQTVRRPRQAIRRFLRPL